MPCTPKEPVARTFTTSAGRMSCLPRLTSPPERRICAASGAEPPPDCRDWRQAHTWNKGHGRLELRELVASTELNEWLAATWPGVGQVFWVQRTTYRQGHWHIQTVYGLTNLSPKQASAARLLEIVRRHWAIENRLHWRRDVTLGEDHCQVRKGVAPQVLAALNSVVLAVFDLSSRGQCQRADAPLGCPTGTGGPTCIGFLADN